MRAKVTDAMKKLILVLLVSACWAQTNTTPSRRDGNQLLQDCGSLIRHADADFRSATDTYGAHWCLGYIDGFLEGFDAFALAHGKTYEEYETLRSIYVCFPSASTIGQDARVLVKWLNDHPERLHEDANLLTFTAFQSAYPCQPKPSVTKKSVIKH